MPALPCNSFTCRWLAACIGLGCNYSLVAETITVDPLYACQATSGPVASSLEVGPASSEVEQILGTIVASHKSMAHPALLLRASAGVTSAQVHYSSFGRNYVITYNPDFIQQLQQDSGSAWAHWAILAHEFGHVYHNHLDVARSADHRQTRSRELAADRFAARVLASLKASKQATVTAIEGLGGDGMTHPNAEYRANAAEVGWQTHHDLAEAAAPITTPPVRMDYRLLKENAAYNGPLVYVSEQPVRPLIPVGNMNGTYGIDIMFDDGIHKGNIQPWPDTASLQPPPELQTQVCLQKKSEAPLVKLRCAAGVACVVTDPVANFSPCSQTSQVRRPFQLMPAALALNSGTNDAVFEGTRPGWTAPSLATLHQLRDKGRGFTEFKVNSPKFPQSSIVAQARWVALGISANDKPVYLDGVAPRYNPMHFDPNRGLNVSFGLETLAFRGEHNGRESIDLTLYFMDDRGRLLAQANLSRSYTALRNATVESFDLDGVSVEWSGRYLLARSDIEYTVTLASAPASRVEFVTWEADYLTKKQLHYPLATQTNLVSVVRPPLGENPNYGIVAGLQDATGKIQFTFDRTQAQQLCTWLKTNHDTHANALRYVRKSDLYTYEMGSGRSIECG